MWIGSRDNLFEVVHSQLQGIPNRRGFYDAPCPFCGKPAKPGQNHFGYNAHSFNCFVCGSRGSLATLADYLRLGTDGYTPTHRVAVPRPAPQPKPVVPWQQHADKLLARYTDHPHRFDAWRRYKPLTAETVARFGFGLGRLPFQRENGAWTFSRQEWLVVPLWENGQLVGLRGRNQTSRGPKWISATGSTHALWGVEFVRPGATTWLCENYVDAAWLMQEHPDWCAVAIGGATTWKAEWAEQLAARQPELVIVALDNDLVGGARGKLLRRLQREWVRDRGTEPPQPNGPKIANALQRAGVSAALFQWPDAAPVKAGLDWILAQRQRQGASP